ncbi:MAG: Na+/H+ antiporter subunit D [Anaerolineales bacterium]|nr:Na+/H+ antiporter subunit D [Anaerolineales bacterium]MDW8162542.1 Na+/H+ antiporter subunit D [Anaerolineales bacterium]
MNRSLVLPIVIPLLTAVLCLLFFRKPQIQRWVSVIGAMALLVVSLWTLRFIWDEGIQAVQIGNWPAPFGITLVADLFSAVMIVLAGVLGLAVAVYSLDSVDAQRQAFGYHPLMHFLLMGVCGAFLTGDLFNLYVWFEVMLMASFVLLALGGERGQMEGAIKYVTLNLLSSAIFLAALGLLYGLAGTLNMADLARKFASSATASSNAIVTALSMLFLGAFGIKAAIFPLFFWLPASYHTPPVAVTALFSGLLTKVGVYSLIRVFTLIFIQEFDYTHTLLLVIAGLTMITGVLGAVAQNEMRRLLSFHIISQIGYPLMGLGIFTPLGLAAAVYFVFHVSLAKSTLFLISGVIGRLRGTFDLKKLGGLYKAQAWLAALFLTAALSLAGLPPSSGFFAKLSLVQAGLGQGQFVIVAISLGVSLLTLFSMIKIWNEVFWKRPPVLEDVDGGEITLQRDWTWLAPILFLVGLTLLISFGIGPAFEIAAQAGRQLMTPQLYIQAVLGGGR